MKKYLIYVLLLVAMLPKLVLALEDDYPLWLKTAPADSLVDPWNMYNRECTSFVAWRLSQNGYQLPLGYGNAGQWGSQARARQVPVDHTPSPGSVAWFTHGYSGASYYGHVAYVAQVNGDQLLIEEYNGWGGPHQYHKRWIASKDVTGFIHFKDKLTMSQLKTSIQSGYYRFQENHLVQVGPQKDSPSLARYQKGQVLYYDQVLEGRGEKWLSYIAYSGNRRYVRIS